MDVFSREADKMWTDKVPRKNQPRWSHFSESADRELRVWIPSIFDFIGKGKERITLNALHLLVISKMEELKPHIKIP